MALLLLGACAAAVLFLADEAEASHFAGGTLSATTETNTTVRFDVTLGLRASAYPNAPVGSVVQSGLSLQFGDGASSAVQIQVTARDDANDHLVGRAVTLAGGNVTPGLRHAYATTGPRMAYAETCCWVGDLQAWNHANNADKVFRLETNFTVGSSSARPAVPLFVTCRAGDVCRVPLPATDPDGDLVVARFSTPREAGGQFIQPGPPHAPNAARIENGQLVWDTAGAQLLGNRTDYSVQIGFGDGGGMVAPAAFILRLDVNAPAPPRFLSPSPCGRTLQAIANEPLRLLVRAQGPQPFGITAETLPDGAALVETTHGTAPTGNVTWTPSMRQRGPNPFVLGTDADPAVQCAFQVDVFRNCREAPAACTDTDGDTRVDANDVCPSVPDPFQDDWDLDGAGDACEDSDGDGRLDAADNCPGVPNPQQADRDGDGVGDICDTDRDGDGVPNLYDNCPDLHNLGQSDLDGDGLGDPCDPDRDGDGVHNLQDNCADAANPQQGDIDGDGLGDVCDPDRDGDQLPNQQDNCPSAPNPNQSDLDGDGVGDACDPIVYGTCTVILDPTQAVADPTAARPVTCAL